MVLEVRDQPVGPDVGRIPPATLVLPGVPLTLIQPASRRERHQLLRVPRVVRVVRLGTTGGGDTRTVVEVVVPERVHCAAAILERAEQVRVLRLVLAGDQYATPRRRLPRGSNDLGQDMGPAGILQDRKSTRLNSSHVKISYAVFCL